MSLRVRTYVRTTVVPRRHATVGCGSAGSGCHPGGLGPGRCGGHRCGHRWSDDGVPRVQLHARSCVPNSARWMSHVHAAIRMGTRALRLPTGDCDVCNSASSCPVRARVPGRGGVAGVDNVDAVGDPSGAAQVLALHARSVLARLLLPRLIEHQHRISRVTQAGDHEGAYRAAIASDASQAARSSSRSILSGVWSQACSASIQQSLRDRSPISPVTYLRACRRGSTLAKHGAIQPISSSRFRQACAASSTVAATAASTSIAVTN
jgi:hypothetical protein